MLLTDCMETNDNFDPFEPIGVAADRLVKLMQDFLDNPHQKQEKERKSGQQQRRDETERSEDPRRTLRSAKE